MEVEMDSDVEELQKQRYKESLKGEKYSIPKKILWSQKSLWRLPGPGFVLDVMEMDSEGLRNTTMRLESLWDLCQSSVS